MDDKIIAKQYVAVSNCFWDLDFAKNRKRKKT